MAMPCCRQHGIAIAGLGIARVPEFLAREALADGRLEQILPDWQALMASLYLLMPPGQLRPVRVRVLADFLIEHLSRRTAD